MRTETVKSDVTVVGGGLAGMNAAIAAARLGLKVALVQNRPVLGGNSSSEVRVWVCGATGHGVNRYARETGIMGELFIENQYRNPEGNPYLWDLTLLEAVKAESNISLFLNTDVREVEAEGEAEERTIQSVTGWMMGSERLITFESDAFIDCTGDGLVGFLAGADFRLGREARHEFNEEWAPEVPDNITLGSTLLFYTQDTGKPVRYVAPSFAKDITTTSIPIRRVIRSGDSGCHYWWIEWGGELDTVDENERIRDELSSVIYGIWDYIKNSGHFDAENMTLEWVGSIPGKREYRRFVGDTILTQNDILAQREFADRIGFGGWSIDLHPPQGMYAQESGSKHLHADGIYHIPFGSLYSKNVRNLFFAGRNISASHVAFGTTRVMATCAIMGEAAGTGAALSVIKGVTPREIREQYMHELQQVMLKQDASIIGLRNEDPLDLARKSEIHASSTMNGILLDRPAEAYELSHDVGILFPVEGSIRGLRLLVSASIQTQLTVEIWTTGRAENYVPAECKQVDVITVQAGEQQWIEVPIQEEKCSPIGECNIFAIIRANEHLQLHISETPITGVITFERGAKSVVDSSLEDHQPDQPVIEWSMKQLVRRHFCFAVETSAYAASKVIDGYVRPFAGPHSWVSEPMTAGRSEWVEARLPDASPVSEIHFTFNDDVNEDLINLHHHETPFLVIPELVKNYDVELLIDGAWQVMLRVKDNHRRKNVHRLEKPVLTDAVRIVIHETNGGVHAELVEMRIYQEATALPTL
ncbi:FAD-dependent oxidoreductase [Paenibacillus sp. FSL F4-0122]|uniref:FAD-dependent oxidoreductase n=1 Tax=Paenibacillus TaxID=44249 RepID=UPI00096D8BF9|nr:FAD-dependent oxidoreductase [Paenibacillus odorifer]OMD16209.1 pyridine nucleotide-disulfide oxidoreductase [Paenibacillus odorifer]OMD29715.1 pyridine nucleotide-disulfide oxidoreductase [Paenibacillus odorifer]OME47188.1 pyridine nucleotide-disulfide oxidoreductase [Paenibacillus odorifer]